MWPRRKKRFEVLGVAYLPDDRVVVTLRPDLTPPNFFVRMLIHWGFASWPDWGRIQFMGTEGQWVNVPEGYEPDGDMAQMLDSIWRESQLLR